MTPQQFLSELRSKGPRPLYLFYGPELHRRKVCRQTLVSVFLGDASREHGFTRYDLEDKSLAEVIDDARSYSLFAARRIIWVSGAEAALPRSAAADANDPDRESLAAYAARPSPEVVLVFDVDRYALDGEDKSKIERVKKFFSAVACQVEFAPLSDVEARKLAADLAQNLGLRIAPAEIDLLVESVGAESARIELELEKLSLLTQGARSITAADIAAMTPDARGATVFALVGALIRGDRTTSLSLLDTLFRQGEYMPLTLALLAAPFRLALAAKEAGLRTQQQIQDYFYKAGIAMWPSRARQVLETISFFSQPQLEGALAGIHQADKLLRDRNPDDRIVMERLVLFLTR